VLGTVAALEKRAKKKGVDSVDAVIGLEWKPMDRHRLMLLNSERLLVKMAVLLIPSVALILEAQRLAPTKPLFH
jgi:hypothetical protein